MIFCDYQILEYTTSELQTEGVPFLVAMRLHEPNSYVLEIFVLRGWKLKLRETIKSDIDEVETFLQDVQEQRDGQFQATAFFEGLSRLNVGPVRSFVSGSCTRDDLDQVIKEFFGESVGSPTWREHFIQIR
jgi:hypothetical protein